MVTDPRSGPRGGRTDTNSEGKMITQIFTIERLDEIVEERQQWAATARAADLHGSAKEYDLTASLALHLRARFDNKDAT